MKLPYFLARRFVAAESFKGAVPKLVELNRKGLRTTVDLLGEYVDDRDRASRSRDIYIQIAQKLAAHHESHNLDRNISIKLSMLGQKINEDFCQDNLRKLLSVARDLGVFVRLDMEGSDTTDSTLRIFEQVYPEFPEQVGVVLQAYLKRTGDDIDRMCELGARVRLCKGAYKEPPELAHQDMSAIQEHFIDYAGRLLTAGHYPGIATHDQVLIDATKAYATRNGIMADGFEFQMLYGLMPRTQEKIVAEGYNMRVYVPFGTEWLPYYSRRLRERKENVWFLLRTLLQR